MGEQVKATIIGTIIVGIFMLISVKMTLNTAWDMARKTKAYIEVQKIDLKRIVKAEKHKTADVLMKSAETIATAKK
jgi:hypothetical protein